MIISIAQPAYLPWLGYFDRIYKSDMAIVLDHVQLERRGFTHRNKVKGQHGGAWLTVPLNKKGNYSTAINEIIINNDGKWEKKHRETLRQCYAKSQFFNTYFSDLSEYYSCSWIKLTELLTETNKYLLGAVGISTPLVFSSKIGISGVKSELILNICKEVGASKYISGPFGREYLDCRQFEREGIEILFHDYKHPKYEQLGGGFLPNMSIVDLLFNSGDQSLDILSSNQHLVAE